MADISAAIFLNFFLYLAIPFGLALILKKNRLSPLTGYMIGGLILSNFFNGIISQEMINNFAYFGIILLLFTIGLEIQFDRIMIVKKFIVLGGLLQLGLSIIFIALASLIFHFSFAQAILIGIALSSSSTTLVAKIIQDRGEESSFHGEIALGILMFQDLAFIPFVIIFNSLTTKTLSPVEIGTKILVDMASSFFLLWFIFFFGKKIIPYIFNKIARISRELLNLFIIIFIFFIGYVSTVVQIPILVSIFIAGILIGQTLEHYHIFTQIRPLRDLLAIIFFIFIGTTIKLDMVFPLLPQILLFTGLIIAIKALIILVIFLLFKFSSKLSFYLSLYLFQIDEDAFILMSIAYLHKIISQEQYLFIVSCILLSLLVTPLFIGKKELVYLAIRGLIKKYLPFLDQFLKFRVDFNLSPIDILEISDHVIICGYGRIGSFVGRALMLANVPFIALDYNFHTVEKAKKEGVNVIYGDPTDKDILDYAEVEKAMVIILALPDRISQEAIIMHAKKMNPKIIIISRVHRHIDHKRMRDLGVEIVIQPEFEASISMIKKIFLLKQILREEIVKKLHYFKLEQGGA